MSTIKNHINTYADLTAYNNDMEKDYPNISYIQGSDEVKWNKYGPDHIVCVYDVTSTESATKLLNTSTNITYQIIDGVQQSSVQNNYTFDTLGEHTVRYKLSGTTIGSSAFNECSSLTSVTIGNGVTSIGSSAFYSCSGLTSITIPNSVRIISNQAFQNCTGLTSVTIPSSVTTITGYAFAGCTSLTSVTISNGVTSIEGFVFQNCTALTSITIPNSVTSIGESAFQTCNGLTSVTIGNGVRRIDYGVFRYCTSLTSITFEATTPPTLGSSAFDNTNNCPIYVPSESVDAYKAATNWSRYASRIQAIPTT